MERIENIGFGELKLIQDPDQFCYGVDAVILADFAARLYPDFKMAADLGTGNGIIPMILSHKNSNADIVGVDVQEGSIELDKKSCIMNGLEDRMDFLCCDIKELFGDVSEHNGTGENLIKKGSFDLVTCNPPYFKKGGAIPSKSKAKFIARHETTAEVEDFIKTAALLLGKQGHLFMVHRPSRLVDIFYYCRKHGLEPKNMRMVVPKSSDVPNIVLIHCIKGAGKELKVMKELAVYNEDGSYSDEIEEIYERVR